MRKAIPLLMMLATSSAEADVDVSSAMKRAVDRYQQMKTFRTEARAVVGIEKDGKLEVRSLESVDFAFDRAAGLRASVEIISTHGGTYRVVAWGPPGAVQSYREDRNDGFLSRLETRTPDEHGGDFSYATALSPSANPAFDLAELLLHARFPHANETAWEARETTSGTELVQRFGEAPHATERRYRLTRDGRLDAIVVRMGTYEGIVHTLTRIGPQEFDGAVEAADLGFAPPADAPAFDVRGPMAPEAKRARLRELADAGNRDAMIRTIGVFSFDSSSATPKVDQYRAVEAKLVAAESAGFGMAYVWHSQVLLPENRDWLPPELARLSDADIRKRQRALLFEGARACAGEAAFALAKNPTLPLTPEERAELATFASACAAKRMPERIATIQQRVDAGSTLEDAFE